MISILFNLNYAILIMYLIVLKILICSNSCFKFVKSCIAPCSAVNSDCILKGLVTFSLWFIYKYPHLAGDTVNKSRNLNNVHEANHSRQSLTSIKSWHSCKDTKMAAHIIRPDDETGSKLWSFTACWQILKFHTSFCSLLFVPSSMRKTLSVQCR